MNGKGKEGQERRTKRGREESWNRAADWLRPALGKGEDGRGRKEGVWDRKGDGTCRQRQGRTAAAYSWPGGPGVRTRDPPQLPIGSIQNVKIR